MACKIFNQLKLGIAIMTSLVEQLDALCIKDDDDRKLLYGYIYRTKRSKKYFLCGNDFIVIPDPDNKKMLLCKMVRTDPKNIFFCFECENTSVLENMELDKFAQSRTDSCIHIDLCKVLFSDTLVEMKKISADSNFVEVLHKERKSVISLVHSAQEKKKRLPGVVILTSRTLKPKCNTCSGKKCLHVNIYIDAAKKAENVEVDLDEDLPISKLDSSENVSKNPYNPKYRKGRESNVFGYKIDFPPNASEKSQIDKINRVDNLFPDGNMVLTLEPEELCDCPIGKQFKYISSIQPGNIESTNVQIQGI